ncbi:cell division protein FtsA [Buchnera aphidicola]|uniref:Cell division protein FtsA n=1 Tax=Buchnera aphidicola (Anoecia oenotherae) TaxID=1241833 RepID=A0A4D6XPS9_9GAMM|nr:cell division protein FtsA [Buchnera aphidicola]QCI19302.1 cell division protein FtsA [Buchnera aphidicola (Anoecia oenotherae)]
MIDTQKKQLIVGLDVGTMKISVVIGEISEKGINIIGIGESKSKGIEKGFINNLKSVTNCLKKALFQAEFISKCKIKSAYVTLSNKYIGSKNEIGIIPISKNKVNETDINHIIHTASSIKINDDYQIIHIIPQEYAIDQQIGIKNPIGLCGKRMEANVHIITCHNNILENIQHATKKNGITIDKFIFSGIASGNAVLTAEEKNLGVCMLDIGAGTIDITIYIYGYLYYSKVIPYAGNMVTNDISYAFSISIPEAEHIKIKYGHADLSKIPKNKNLKILDTQGNVFPHITIEKLTEVIEARYIELLSLVQLEIEIVEKKLKNKNHSAELKSGIVITGNGSQIKSLTTCSYNVFNKKIRIGSPLNTNNEKSIISTPKYSTAVGLLHYGKKKFKQNKNTGQNNTLLNRYFKKIYNWLYKEF